MGKLFYIIGKSSTGKDTIYKEICDVENLHLYPVVMYTTRPIRAGEADGREYYFVNEATLKQLEREKRVVEKRIYHTIQGTWTYFTVDDEKMDLSKRDYLSDTYKFLVWQSEHWNPMHRSANIMEKHG